MSYYVSSYLTDAKKIKSIYGSKNLALYDELKNKLEEELEELDSNFEDEFEEGQNAKEVLLDIINGQIRFPELDYLYGYVYIELCKHYGEQFFTDEDEISSGYFWFVGSENSAFIPIPFSDDFPQIESIAVEDLESQRKIYHNAQFQPDYNNEYPEEVKAFEQIFTTAIQANKDLLLVCF